MSESDLYPAVREWFRGRLAVRFRGRRVEVYDTSRTSLSALINSRGYQAFFPQSNVWDIKTDVTALILGKTNDVAFVECKIGCLTLRDVGQLLGYSIVARPVLSVLLSPQAPSDPLASLLRVYGRYDVLEYGLRGERIRIVRWDVDQRTILPPETLPPGEHV
jgi:hypothetical protein